MGWQFLVGGAGAEQEGAEDTKEHEAHLAVENSLEESAEGDDEDESDQQQVAPLYGLYAQQCQRDQQKQAHEA